MWKLISASAQGTSHRDDDTPCQDRTVAEELVVDDKVFVVLCCADGAGSAFHSELGATIACRTMFRTIKNELDDGHGLTDFRRDVVIGWIECLRREIQEEAQRIHIESRQLACTVLTAVVGESSALFFQIGDGGIVTRTGDKYFPVFWPQSGEYANTTNFITDDDAAERAVYELRAEHVDELALFTDGIERLVLQFTDQTAHAPFFASMFHHLKSHESVDELSAALYRYLNSDTINNRTNDDKSLILATRLQADAI